MSYNSSPTDHYQDMFQYGYSSHNHYISDGSSTTGGDDTTFWTNSPTRSESPSPNINIFQNSVGNTYLYNDGCTANRYAPYRSAYPIMNSDSGITTHIHSSGSFVRVIKRRSTANKKERRRTQSINNAYTELRDCIPNVPADTKLSKIKTLRLATSYITYLTRALETDDPAGGFKAELGTISRKANNSRMPRNDCPNEDASAKTVSSEDMGNSRKAKGRTGWPQHVWALELKQEQAL